MDLVEQLGATFVDDLCRLAGALERAGHPFAIIGATALLLHDVDLPRTTRDLDLAVTVSGGLEAIRPMLGKAGLIDTAVAHRFRTADGIEVDILAMDPMATRPSEIQLPDGDWVDAVALPEAVAHVVELAVGTRGVPGAPLCLLIANKLHAARSRARPHDLEDACAAMAAHESTGTRRYEIDYETHPALRFETGGAFLAGRDVAGLVESETKAAIDSSIVSLLQDARMSDRFAEGLERRDLVLAYRMGLRAG